MNFNMLWD